MRHEARPTGTSHGKEPTMTSMRFIAEPRVPQVVITREFGAPRELLFRAHTDPDLLVQWLAPRRLTMTIDRFDLRDGGTWRYQHWEADGTDHAFHGVFHGEPSPDGIVWTFESEGAPGHVCLRTVTFSGHGGKTLLSHNTVYQSVEDRDLDLQAGMEERVSDSMDRLDGLLARLAPVGR
jgi:uncharacterized protein YndB with AHSA1/START domain